MKWEYLTAYYFYQEKDKTHPEGGFVFLFKDSGVRTLDDGLNVLGQQGWELVGIQPQFQLPIEGGVVEQALNSRYGKPATYMFTTNYIFKRPVKGSSL